MFRYSLESLWRNRGRYLLFGILFAFLGGAWLISLLLGHASTAIREDLIDTFGRTVVVEQVNPTVPGEPTVMHEALEGLPMIDTSTCVEYIQANVLVRRVYTPIERLAGLSLDKETVHMVGLDFADQFTPFTRRSNPYPLVEGRLPAAEGECLIFTDMYTRFCARGLLDGLGGKLSITVYTMDAETYIRAGYDYNGMELPVYDTVTLTVVGTVARESIPDLRYQMAEREGPHVNGKATTIRITPIVFFTDITTARRFPALGQSVHGTPGVPLQEPSEFELISGMTMLYHLRDYHDFAQFEAQVNACNASLSRAAYQRMQEKMRAEGSVFGDLPLDEFMYLGLERPDAPFYRARTYLDGFDALIAPFEIMKEMADQMAANLSLLAATLLFVLTVLNLYARTYEIGVLRCIGMSRGRISVSLLFEHGIFLMLSLGCGALLGGLLAGRVLPLLFEAVYREYLTDAVAGFPAAAGRILLVGLGLSLLASVCSVFYIQRCRPLAILRNRN